MTDIITHLEKNWQQDTFVKMTLSTYKGNEPALKNLYLKKIYLKKQPHLSFTFRYKTRDIIKNYDFEEAKTQLAAWIGFEQFSVITLFTLEADLVWAYQTAQKVKSKTMPPSQQQLPESSHDKAKQKHISPKGKTYLHALGITDEKGNVYKKSQDKYRQINHYIELLRPLIAELPQRESIKVYDMGAGKGYLTFALYDYLTQNLGINVELTGVEFREDLVQLGNQIAQDTGFEQLRFGQGTIEQYPIEDAHILVALHACDTATDEAIYKGIQAQADLIVVAPCCHKQIRREMEKNPQSNELDFLLKYGIFLERQAEMLTDALRALLLNYYGYKTKALEFISDAHTPKNVMLIASKKELPTKNTQQAILEKINHTLTHFGIGYHHLQKLLGLS